MGKDLYTTFKIYREVMEEASDVLSLDLKKMIHDGSEAELKETRCAQPAILVVSYATYRVLGQFLDNIKPDYLAGHSLGECTALLVADAFAFKDALYFISERSKAMEEANVDGAMAAIIGLDIPVVESLLNQDCVIANDNCPGQIVISGHSMAVEDVMHKAKARGARMVKKLAVSGPFHSPWMSSAAEKLTEVLDDLSIGFLSMPYVPNVTAHATSDNTQVKSFLIQQITGRVRWRETMLNLKEQGVNSIIEIGPGKVLQGLVKRTDASLHTTSLNTPYDIEYYVESTLKKTVYG